MKQRTLGLCILALVTLATTSAAYGDTFDFSFSGPLFSGSGTFTATEKGSSDIYDITGVTGTVKYWAGSSQISSLGGLGDNELTYPGIVPGFLLPTSFFDSKGVSFGLANGDLINLSATWGIEEATIGAPKGLSLPESDIVEVSKNSPVPEPSTLALFGTGIFGIAGAMRLKLRFG
jgi:PEP-CTERM motif